MHLTADLHDCLSNSAVLKLEEQGPVDQDPNYALSWASIGTIYSFRYIKTTDQRDLHTGIGYLRQAITLDPDLAEAYTSLAYAYLRLRDFDAGIRSGRRATELEPTSTAAHHFLAANYLGSMTEARKPKHFGPAVEHFAAVNAQSGD